METAFQNDDHSMHARLLQVDFMKYWKIFHNYCSVHRSSMFTIASLFSTHGHKVQGVYTRTYHWIVGKDFLSLNLWNESSERVATLTSLCAFKNPCMGSDQVFKCVNNHTHTPA